MPERVVRVPTTALAQTAAELLAEAVELVDRRRGRARVAIPGGSALQAVAPLRACIPEAWTRVCLTWTDERCVPVANPLSNRGSAYKSGALSHAAPCACELPLWLDRDTPAAAVSNTEAALRTQLAGALDVVLLGMGEDGHVASLFPGHGALAASGLVCFVPDSPKPPPERITLTLPILQSATCIVLLAAGEAKRKALERLVAGEPDMPATRLPSMILVTDQDIPDA